MGHYKNKQNCIFKVIWALLVNRRKSLKIDVESSQSTCLMLIAWAYVGVVWGASPWKLLKIGDKWCKSVAFYSYFQT